VEIVLPGEDVRGRQPHERELGAVGPAANRALAKLEAGASNGLARVLDHVRMMIEYLAHIPILFLDDNLHAGAVT